MRNGMMRKALTFGDLIENVYRAYGQRRAKGILELLLKAHWVGFPGRHRYLLSRRNGK